MKKFSPSAFTLTSVFSGVGVVRPDKGSTLAVIAAGFTIETQK